MSNLPRPCNASAGGKMYENTIDLSCRLRLNSYRSTRKYTDLFVLQTNCPAVLGMSVGNLMVKKQDQRMKGNPER
jgi:hypothetical protein